MRKLLTTLFLTGIAAVTPACAQMPESQSYQLGLQVDQMIASQLSQLGVPGYAITVMQNGRVIFQRCYGYSDPDSRTAVTPDTIFGIASLTKTFTAATLMSLVDQGLIKLDDPAGKYVRDLPGEFRGLTIRQLGSMIAGMRKGIPNEVAWPQELKILGRMPLSSAPGTQYQYANPSFRLLGTVMENVTGRPYMELVNNFILRPLAMNSTGPIQRFIGTPALTQAFSVRNGQVTRVPYKPDAISFSAGMLASSSNDLARYAQALLDRQLPLSPGAYETIFDYRPALPDGTVPPWAFGWGHGHDAPTGMITYGMNGGDPGVSSTILMFPKARLVVVALSNLNTKPVYRIPHMVARMYIRAEQQGLQQQQAAVDSEPEDYPGAEGQ